MTTETNGAEFGLFDAYVPRCTECDGRVPFGSGRGPMPLTCSHECRKARRRRLRRSTI